MMILSTNCNCDYSCYSDSLIDDVRYNNNNNCYNIIKNNNNNDDDDDEFKLV
jgi:hypothetical protein